MTTMHLVPIMTAVSRVLVTMVTVEMELAVPMSMNAPTAVITVMSMDLAPIMTEAFHVVVIRVMVAMVYSVSTLMIATLILTIAMLLLLAATMQVVSIVLVMMDSPVMVSFAKTKMNVLVKTTTVRLLHHAPTEVPCERRAEQERDRHGDHQHLVLLLLHPFLVARPSRSRSVGKVPIARLNPSSSLAHYAWTGSTRNLSPRLPPPGRLRFDERQRLRYPRRVIRRCPAAPHGRCLAWR